MRKLINDPHEQSENLNNQDPEALFGGPLSYKQFRRLFPAIRNFQRYDHYQRAEHRASHRLGHRQRERVGEHFYTHQPLPDVCYSTARQVTVEAYQIYLAQFGTNDDTGTLTLSDALNGDVEIVEGNQHP